MGETIKIRTITADTVLSSGFADCFAYWAQLPTTDGLPAYTDFQLDRLNPRLVPWSVVVDVMREPTDYRFRFWGTERAKLIGAEMTGKNLSDIADRNMRDGNRMEYDTICRERVPMLCDTPIATSSGRRLSHESIRLPFGGEDGNVSQVFSAIDPQQVTSDHYDYFGTEPRQGI